jgi:alkylhydroperoxidase/carboxymuconolactone decarboxylase family protein YurZ
MTAHEVRRALAVPYRQLKEQVPEVVDALGDVDAASMADGVLSAKAKELIAPAVRAARECGGCNAPTHLARCARARPRWRSRRRWPGAS